MPEFSSLRKFGDSPELGTMVRSLNTFLTDASAANQKAEAGGSKAQRRRRRIEAAA